MSRRAKIVCTLGPATSGPGMITQLVAAGLDVARLNMSHGDHDAHELLLMPANDRLSVCRSLLRRG